MAPCSSTVRPIPDIERLILRGHCRTWVHLLWIQCYHFPMLSATGWRPLRRKCCLLLRRKRGGSPQSWRWRRSLPRAAPQQGPGPLDLGSQGQHGVGLAGQDVLRGFQQVLQGSGQHTLHALSALRRCLTISEWRRRDLDLGRTWARGRRLSGRWCKIRVQRNPCPGHSRYRRLRRDLPRRGHHVGSSSLRRAEYAHAAAVPGQGQLQRDPQLGAQPQLPAAGACWSHRRSQRASRRRRRTWRPHIFGRP
mmetsp:Transcript_84520/g.225876  ORF Transcript_84520/g.225876 Transcript_84520/m.225876 type:complete len:250 (-) Transcript_84520:751-1500(-)